MAGSRFASPRRGAGDTSVDVVPVTRDRWDDLVGLFERKRPRGGTPVTAGCWCMWWRERTVNAERNKRAMEALVRAGREPGLLAYESGLPVGWVSVDRRDAFGQLVRSRTYRPVDDEPDVWSIVCFYVDPRSKRRGVGAALLRAAIDHALGRGARTIEAYPHERGDYMGSPARLGAAGFEPVRSTGTRTIMRYDARSRGQ